MWATAPSIETLLVDCVFCLLLLVPASRSEHDAYPLLLLLLCFSG
jgi:hypothetical protein